jgi:hypothetical protein
MRGVVLSVVLGVTVMAGTADARPAEDREEAEAGLARLHDRVAADVTAGRPLVVEVHVPLCDNRVLRCGNGRLGDGDEPGRNLYWGTSGGFKGWFGRKGSGWRELGRLGPDGEILETRIWATKVTARGALRARGVRGQVEVIVIARAWRGTSIEQAMKAYAADLFGDEARHVQVGDRAIAGGGAAHLVAFVGHNGWMDVASFDWPAGEATAVKGTVAIACLTEDYLAGPVPSPRRVPLLMTRSLLFAGAHGFEGAVSAFARGEDLRQIHLGAARAYAAGQDKPVARAFAAFTNPAARTWRR